MRNIEPKGWKIEIRDARRSSCSPRPQAGEGPGVRAACVQSRRRLVPVAGRPSETCVRAQRGGFTLIELLIVITLLLLLTLAALVTLAPSLEGRKVREAARMVNSYLASARSKAMDTGRPCGVIFRCFNSSAYSMTLEQCEEPEIYAGGTTSSTATISWSGSSGTITFYYGTTSKSSESLPSAMISPGGEIQINNQGPFFSITNVTDTITLSSGSISDFSSGDVIYTSSGKWGTISSVSSTDSTLTVTVTSANFLPGETITSNASTAATGVIGSAAVTTATVALTDTTQTLPWSSTASSYMPYRIRPFPRVNSAATLELPTGAVVDFTGSGIGDNTTTYQPWNYQAVAFTSSTSSTFSASETISASTSSLKTGLIVQIMDITTSGGTKGVLLVRNTGSVNFAASDSITGSSGKTATVSSVASADLTLMFAPNGSIEGYYAGTKHYAITDPVFFLVGKRERMENTWSGYDSSKEATWLNTQDLGNFWIVINPINGLISSDVMASSSGASSLANAIIAARSLARDSQGMGGK